MTANERQDMLEFLAATAGACCAPSDIWNARFDYLCAACAAATDAARGTPRTGTLPRPDVDRQAREERHSHG